MEINTITTFGMILSHLRELPRGLGLFLPDAEIWSVNTVAMVVDLEEHEYVLEDPPSCLRDAGLRYRLQIQTIQGIAQNARAQLANPSKVEIIQAIEYYYRNDAYIEFGNENGLSQN